ncbi:MAG: biotin/lipoyl-binding protein, partial [Bacteroidetes bacterium]|nr:biotin/lipoyl-binding protein [Bacteroidota bacterium]
EAMKMKTNISSPQTGKIKAIKVKVGDKIESGQMLLTFE